MTANLKSRIALTAVVALATCGINVPAQAAVMFSGSTSNPANNTLLVDTTGALVTAVNFGGGNTTNNGVNFTGISTQNGSNNGISFAHSGGGAFGGGATVNGSSAVDPLFMTLVFFNNQAGPHNLAVSGLNPSKSYLAEFMWGEGRTSLNGNFDLSLTGNTSLMNAVVGNFTYGGATPNGPETKKTTRFLLSGESGFNLNIARDGGTLGPAISGYQIRELAAVPEPASFILWTLVGFILAGVAYCRFGRQ